MPIENPVAVGINGSMRVEAAFLVIERGKGLLTLATQGLKGNKRIPFSSITSVQFKAATGLTNGFLQIGVLGGNESSRGLFAATQDENSVMFRAGQQGAFEALRDHIEANIGGGQANSASATSPGPDYAEQLQKLASLRDQGILSEEEFQAKKAEILSRM